MANVAPGTKRLRIPELKNSSICLYHGILCFMLLDLDLMPKKVL